MLDVRHGSFGNPFSKRQALYRAADGRVLTAAPNFAASHNGACCETRRLFVGTDRFTLQCGIAFYRTAVLAPRGRLTASASQRGFIGRRRDEPAAAAGQGLGMESERAAAGRVLTAIAQDNLEAAPAETGEAPAM
jgi:hypothetical protein